MRKSNTITILLVVMLLCTGCGASTVSESSSSNNTILDPKNPITITIWHYYSGAQQDAFDAIVDEFNDTEGEKIGVIVESSGYGSANDVTDSVAAAVEGKVGAKEVPNIFAGYPDQAYKFDEKGILIDQSQYLTVEEQEEYIESFIEEGRFNKDNSLKIFPIAKATEIFMINKTEWDKFSTATGAILEECKTIEGLVSIAEKYYTWTDSLTLEANDGKAFYGRDSMANYFVIGSKQLGHDIFSLKDGQTILDFHQETIRALWDNYYIPYIKGYFSSSGRFRSDDIKTGNIIAFTGSSSGATFFPKEVVVNDAESYAITMESMEAPKFKDGENYALQQGAGMAVTNADEKEVFASMEFLKWFTDAERNISFSLDSGYLPVKKEATKENAIEEYTKNKNKDVVAIVETSIDTVNENTLYTMKSFENGTKARDILEYSMSDKAVADREKVVKNLASGMSYEEAIATFLTEDNFMQWYNETKVRTEQLVK
ncbi:extracellular solute-binding protein [Lachnospiraceae bacterium LCP25S3_G4]